MANINIKKELAPKGLDFKPSEFVISDKWCTILTVVSYPKWIGIGFLSNLAAATDSKIVIKHIPLPFSVMSKMLNKQLAELKAQYEKENDIHFDYIFLASGTGTTQAGLVCGQLMNKDDRRIVGISIARRNPRGKDVVIDSVKEYLNEQKLSFSEEEIFEKTVFVDELMPICYAHKKGGYDPHEI